MNDNLTPEPVAIAKTMSFLDAMREIKNGNSVRRESWTPQDYCLMKDGYLTIHTKGDYHTWIINDGDMEGEDYIIIEKN